MLALRIENHAQIIALEEAIRERWKFRGWYRTQARVLFEGRWDDLAAENDIEIRRLIRKLRRERSWQTRFARAVNPMRPGWTETELREAYGR